MSATRMGGEMSQADTYRERRVLITGGAGFLGGHLVRRLLADGHEVLALDNLSSGDLERLAPFRDHPGFSFIEHDVTEPLPELEVDRIYNLACVASPAQYQRDPVQTTLTSVLGALHALRLAQRTGARVLQASTSEVYGDPEVHPQHEEYQGQVNPVGPRACYDEGKRCAESLMADFQRRHGVQTRIARIFNTYGPGMALGDGRVLINFIVQALRSEPLTVYGEGNQTRSLCYVDDLVDGLIALMEHPDPVGPINLGSPDEQTVLDLARTVLQHLPGSRIIHLPLPPDDPQRRRPDLTRARRILGFQPTIPLNEGLQRTIEDVRQRLARAPRLSSTA